MWSVLLLVPLAKDFERASGKQIAIRESARTAAGSLQFRRREAERDPAACSRSRQVWRPKGIASAVVCKLAAANRYFLAPQREPGRVLRRREPMRDAELVSQPERGAQPV